MKLSHELRLRLIRDFAGLCGIGTLVYGVNHLLAAAGSDWGFIEQSRPRSQLLWGLLLVATGALCTWVRFLASREVRRVDKQRRELLARALGARAEDLLHASLHRSPPNQQTPKPV